MPNVGVLNLQIRDDSNEAAGGLDQLVSKLRSLSKIASTKNEGLANVAQHVREIVAAATVSDTKALTSFKNIGTFLNSLPGLTKLNSISKLNVKPIKDLKSAIGSGFNIGQAGTQINRLKDALSGEWNVENARSARDAMKTIASGVKDLQKAGPAKVLDAVSGALEKYYGVFGSAKTDETKTAFAKTNSIVKDGVVDYAKAVEEYGEVIKETKLTFKEPIGDSSSWRDQMLGASSDVKKATEEVKSSKSSFNDLRDLVDIFNQMRMTTSDGLHLDLIISSLEKIKEITTGGIGLASVANGIQKLNASAQETVSTGTIETLNSIAAALANVKAQTEGMNLQSIKISFGGGRGGGSRSKSREVTDVISTIENASDSVSEMFTNIEHQVTTVATGVEHVTANVDDMVNSLKNAVIEYQNMGWTAENTFNSFDNGFAAFKAGFAEYSRAMSGRALGGGKSPLLLGDGGVAPEKALSAWVREAENWQTGWETVSDKAEQVQAALEYVQSLKSKLFYGIETGQIGKEEALGIASQIENLEKKIPILDDSWKKTMRSMAESTKEAKREIYDWGDAVREQTARNQEAWKRRDEMMAAEQIKNHQKVLELFADSKPEVQQQIADMEGFDVSEFQRYKDALGSVGEAADGTKQQVDNLRDSMQRGYGNEMVNDLVNQYTKTDLMRIKLDGMKQALADDINANRVDTQQIAERTMRIQEASDALEKLKTAQDMVSNAVGTMNKGWKSFKGAIKETFPTLTGMLKRFSQIAKYRFLRTVLKQITSGAKEGLENVYRYSQMVGTGFAPAMDSAASALAQMKNSIGAAIAPALQALIPILNQIVSGFINVINVVNQFLSILGGQNSWTRAKPYAAKAFDDIKESAKGANAATKDLLADWDELNIIQSESSGSGSGTGKEVLDYESMFETVTEFDKGIGNVVNFLKDNFDEILATVIAIKSGIFAWRLGKRLSDALPLLGKVAKGFAVGATIGLTLMLSDLTGKAYAESGSPAWLIADALTGAVGSFLAGQLATQIAGGVAGSITSGFTLVLAGSINIKNAVEAMETGAEAEAWMLGVLGSVELGIGAAIAAGAIAGATISGALLTGLAVTLAAAALTIPILLYVKKRASYKKMAIEAFKQTGANGISTEDYMRAVQARLRELTKGATLIVDSHLEFADNGQKLQDNLDAIYKMNAVIKSGDTITEEEAEQFKKSWHTVFEAMNELSTISFNSVYEGLSEVVANGSAELKEQARELRKQTIELAGIVGGTRGRLEKEMELIVNTITSGTADEKELEKAIARYDEIYELLTGSQDESYKELKEMLDEGRGFDFTGEDNPVDAAIEFLGKLSDEDFDSALDTVQKAYEAQVDYIEQIKKELKLALDAGDIKKTDYDKFLETLLGDEAVLAKRLEEQKKEINDLKKDTYMAVIEQAWKGLTSAQTKGEGVAEEYIKNVIEPILKAAEEAGQDTSLYRNALKELAEKFDPTQLFDVEFDQSAREKMYQEFYDEFGTSNKTIGTISRILSLDVELQTEITKGGNKIIDSGSELAKEIINSLLNVNGLEYGTTIESLAELTGWSIQDILGQIDLSRFNTEELEVLLEAVKSLKEDYEFNNPVSPTDVSEANERTRQIAQAYEDMAMRIRYALNSIGGIGGAASVGIFASIPAITGRASGGFVKSGDIVMANENGNFEMMGRMGNQPVVANNQQIVSGITQGVSTANEGVESRLGTIESLLVRIINKEFVAKATPSSAWAAMNERSGVAYDRVNG